MQDRLKRTWSLLTQTGVAWRDDNVTRLAASLAYYTLLSLAPLLVLCVAIAALLFGEQAARGQVASALAGIVGPDAGKAVQSIVRHAQTPDTTGWSSAVGLIVLLFGASGVFGELQSALNVIWKVEPKPGRGVWGVIRDRFTSFTMVLSVAFLLLVSLVLSAALSAVGAQLAGALPGGEVLWQGLNLAISFAVISLLFASIFKVVPDVEIGWRDVWLGGAITALLFSIGKFVLGLYLGRSSLSSPYGAAGSLIVLVVWVYYSAQILFLGAEFTRVYARSRGARVMPSPNAVPSAHAT